MFYDERLQLAASTLMTVPGMFEQIDGLICTSKLFPTFLD